MPDQSGRVSSGRPQAEGGVWGSYVEYLAVLEAEAQQYREAMSHHRQIAEHYRDALAAVVAVRSHVSYPATFDFDAAMAEARVALDNPPEWNGVLHA